jgi:hypothetical protein
LAVFFSSAEDDLKPYILLSWRVACNEAAESLGNRRVNQFKSSKCAWIQVDAGPDFCEGGVGLVDLEWNGAFRQGNGKTQPAQAASYDSDWENGRRHLILTR